MVKLQTLSAHYLSEFFWLKQQTKDTTQRAVRYFVGYSGNLQLDRLCFRHFEKYKHWLVKSGRSKTTANIYLRSIKRLLNWAVQSGLIATNPMDDLQQYKVTRKPIRIYEDWEVRRMVRFCSDKRWKTIILMARATGLRRSAILNLTMNNIRAGYVWVEPKRNTPNTWLWEPKDREIRRVPLPGTLSSLLKSLPTFYPMLSARTYANLLRRKNIFGSLPERLSNLPEQNFRRTFINIQRKAFGRQIGDFHSLRKTYTTMMCGELPDYFVARLTGHNSLKTMTYYLASRESYYDTARDAAAKAIKGCLGSQSVQERRHLA